MSLVDEFHTLGTEDGDRIKYHNQTTCHYAEAITRNRHVVPGRRLGDSLCDRCRSIAAGK